MRDDLGAGVEMFGLVTAAAVVARHTARAEAELERRGGGPDAASILSSLSDIFSVYRRSDPPSDSVVSFPPARSGATVETLLWIHNPGESATGPVSFRVERMTSAEGGMMPVGALTLQPAVVTGVEAGGRAEIRVRLDVPPGQPPGWYHGLVFASVAPDGPIVLRAKVEP